MTWLVTGANGQLGMAFQRAILPHGVCFANRTTCDLANPNSIKACLEREQPSVIINCAACTAVDAAEKNEPTAMRVNSEAVGEIAYWAACHRALMVHFSTDYVFNGDAIVAYREEAPVDPQSAYGRSKAAGEEKFLASGASGMCLRTSWVHSNDGTNFLLTIKRLLQERSQLKVVIDQHGVPTTTDFLVDVTLSLIDQHQKTAGDMPRLIHAVPEGKTSWFGFANHIRDLLRAYDAHQQLAEIKPIPSSEFPQAAKRPANSVMANELLQSILGKPLGRWEDWHDNLHSR